MKKCWLSVALLLALVPAAFAQQPNAAHKQNRVVAAPSSVSIGGEPVVVLKRPQNVDQSKPQFLTATVAPGRGMAILQLTAYVPGKGEVEVLTAPSLGDAKDLLDNQDDKFGNKIFTIGGAFLVPYANRIRGKVSSDGNDITTSVAGQSVHLPANWSGKNPGAEKHSMHGLMLKSKFENVQQHSGPQASTVSGIFHAGDWEGHWPSNTDVTVRVALSNQAADFTVTAKNVGKDPLPIGIGWHPYFAIPSGDRKQARLHLPANKVAGMNNYDDVFPTGEVHSVTMGDGKYNFTAAEGKPLDDIFLDDNFQDLKRGAAGSATSEVIDPAAKYGIRVRALSPEIKSIQVYSPPDKSFVAIEPQFNLPDPYGSEWKNTPTGMVLLKPGQSTSWHVRLELFTPAK
jgi:galactose mutarotase-like enzyme